MKNYFLFLIFLVGTIMNVQAQNNIDTTKKNNVVHLPEYYKEEGVIFSKDYVVGIDMKGLKSRYTPTIDDIAKLEDIFAKKYNEIGKTNVDTKIFFCRWVRQYVGLIDSNENKNIIVQLIDNTKPRKINKLLGTNWEDVFIIMLADSFYKVSTIFRINIDTGDMTTQL
jgi:hypothetical protein